MTVFTFDIPNMTIEADTFGVDAQELGNAIKIEMSKLENLPYRKFLRWTGNDPVGPTGFVGLNLIFDLGWTLKWPAQPSVTFAEVSGGTIGDTAGNPPFSNVPADNIFPTRSIDRTPAKAGKIELEEIQRYLGIHGRKRITSDGSKKLLVYGTDKVTVEQQYSVDNETAPNEQTDDEI